MSLCIRNLTKTYPNGVKAIDHLSLDIEKGMFGLLGPNGAGKSSLMRTIATLQKPDAGQVFFEGVDIWEDPLSFRKKLGYLPQDFGVYPKESAEHLLNYFAVLKGIADKKERLARVGEVLALTNLYEVRKKHVSSFSGGMRQRFGIAQLLLNNPKLIIVDEPTAGLDPAERNRFLNILREIGTENIVIFSTHLVEDVTELCTDMAIIDQGKVQVRNTPAQAVQALEGRVWTKTIDKAALTFHQQHYHYLSSSFNADNSLSIRVFAEEQPDATFTTAERVSLEDVYFITLGKTASTHV